MIGPATGLSPTAEWALERMARTSSSEGKAIAEALKEIAENGDGAEADEHLIACAQEILGWAAWFISAMGGEPEIRDGDYAN